MFLKVMPFHHKEQRFRKKGVASASHLAVCLQDGSAIKLACNYHRQIGSMHVDDSDISSILDL